MTGRRDMSGDAARMIIRNRLPLRLHIRRWYGDMVMAWQTHRMDMVSIAGISALIGVLIGVCLMVIATYV